MNTLAERVLTPPAKINLFLDVGAPRSDGYHDIISVFQTIGLRDRLIIRPGATPGISVSTSDKALPTGSDNTLCKAYEVFHQICPEVPPLCVVIEKRIPQQAGLGGGSSDAGVFLRYLRQTFAPQLAEKQVLWAAAQVGSDVPFFLSGGTCLVEGRGERVTRLPSLPPCPVLLFHPQIEVSTAAAYKALDKLTNRPHPEVEPMRAAILKGDWTGVFSCLFNSFEQSVLAQHELLSAITSFCVQQGFPAVLLAGSGSNLFVLHHRVDRLQRLQREARTQFPQVATTLTYTVASKDS